MGTDSSHQIQSHPHNISSITKNSSFFKRKKQILMLNYLSLGKGKSFVKIWICFFRSSSTVWSPRLRIALSIKRTIFLTSSSKIPLVVIAEIPILTPEGRKGGRGSWGISDLETEIPTWSSTFSTSAPSNSSAEKSSTIIWLSVHQVTSLYPRLRKLWAIIWAFLSVCLV